MRVHVYPATGMLATTRNKRVQNAGTRAPSAGDTGKHVFANQYLHTHTHTHTHTCNPVLTRGRTPLLSGDQGFRPVFPLVLFTANPTAQIQHIGLRGADDGEGGCKRQSANEPSKRHGNTDY